MKLKHGASVLLQAEPAKGNLLQDGRAWCHVATAGEYRGYQRGARILNLTSEMLHQMVSNLRRRQEYKPDLANVGSADVVPFDFHHASELVAANPSIAGVEGVPAQAWVQELEVRAGDRGDELWALTRYMEPARTYVKVGKFKRVSIAADPEFVDQLSGEIVGCVLTSVAFTNHPFIEGMAPLAATAGAQAVESSGPGLAKATTHLGPATPTADERNPSMSLMIKLSQALGVESDETKVEKTVEQLLKTANADRMSVADLVKALGATTKEEALDKIAHFHTVEEKLEATKPAIQEMREEQVKSEEASEAADVDNAIAAHNLSDAARYALECARSGSVKLSADMGDAEWAESRKRKAQAKAEFLAKYPPLDPKAAAMLTNVATHATAKTAGPSAPAAKSVGTESTSERDAILAQKGNDIVTKAMAQVSCSQPGLSFKALHFAGVQLAQNQFPEMFQR